MLPSTRLHKMKSFFEHIFGRKIDGEVRWPTKEGMSFAPTYCRSCWLMVKIPLLERFARTLEERYKRSIAVDWNAKYPCFKKI